MNTTLILLGVAEIFSAILHLLAIFMFRTFRAPKSVKLSLIIFFALTAVTQGSLGAYWIAHAWDPREEPFTLIQYLIIASMVLRAYALNAVTGMGFAWLWHRKDHSSINSSLTWAAHEAEDRFSEAEQERTDIRSRVNQANRTLHTKLNQILSELRRLNKGP